MALRKRLRAVSYYRAKISARTLKGTPVDPSKTAAVRLATRPFHTIDDFESHWNRVDVLTLPAADRDRYIVGFASSEGCVEQVQRMRYEVFNLELGEGLSESIATGLDQDEFDDQMTHLVLLERSSNEVVGTYRVQTVSHALAHKGIYSAAEYDLTGLEAYFAKSIELGRACLTPKHRSFRAIHGIWLGIGEFMNLYSQRYLFGCCSLTTQDPDDGWRAMKTIRSKGYLHPEVLLSAKPDYTCSPPEREFAEDLGDATPLPKLFKTYMHLGAKVVSEPALDCRFGTVDFLVLLDGHAVSLSSLDVVK